MSCEISISTALRLAFPDTDWRTDTLLPLPELIFPINEQTFCLELQGNNTQICLSWLPTLGATVYLLQWSLDPQFTGPSLREAILNDPTTSYCLNYPADIRQGESVYWRVQAANTTTGGVSAKSEKRKLTYSCGENQNADKCAQYNVEAKINGVSQLACCEFATYWLELSYDCEDVYGNTLIVLEDIVWSTTDDVATTTEIDPDNLKKVGVRACTEETQVFEVKATLHFKDFNGEVFECEAEGFPVIADCGDPSSKTFPVRLDEKFQGVARGVLDACGDDLSAQDCYECRPCTEDYTIEEHNTYEISPTIFVYSGNFNNETCRLRYNIDVTFATNTEIVYHEVLKGDGKSVGTVPSEDLDDRWIFLQPANEEYTIRLIYEGCWAKLSEPYFSILQTVGEEEAETFEIGYYVKPIGKMQEFETKFVNIAGPVHAVRDYSLVGVEKWPDCDSECVCEYGKLKVTYDERERHLVPYWLDNTPSEFILECDCTECEEGRITVELISTDYDLYPEEPACTLMHHTIQVSLYCRDELVKTEEFVIGFTCALDVSSDNTLAFEYCGCNFYILVETVLGNYDLGDKPCENLQKEVVVCFQRDTEETPQCFEKITYNNGEWEYPENLQKIYDDYVFALRQLRFEDCELYADICQYNILCNSCNSLLCDCDGECKAVANSFEFDVVYDSNPAIQVVFTVDCEKGYYKSEDVTIPNPSGCTSKGNFYIEDNILIFRGRDSNGTEVEFTGDEINNTCGGNITGEIDVFTTCYSAGQVESVTVVEVDIIGGHTVDCECDELEVHLEVTNCFPLVASGTVEIPGGTLEVSIGGDVDECGCLITDAQEARVNLGLGCGLKAGTDKSINQKHITLDYDSLVGVDSNANSLAVYDELGCPHITLPICDCIDFELVEGGNPLMYRPKRYVHKGLTYRFIALEDIDKLSDGRITLVDFNGLSSHYMAVTVARNLIADLKEGDFGIMLVTNGCEKFIVALDKVRDDTTTTVDPVQASIDNILNTECEGRCKYEWDDTEEEWVLINDGCSTSTSTTDTSTTDTPTTEDCYFPGDPRKNTCELYCISEDDEYDTAYIVARSNCNKDFICDESFFGEECESPGDFVSIPCVNDPEVTTTTGDVNNKCLFRCNGQIWEHISGDCDYGYVCPEAAEAFGNISCYGTDERYVDCVPEGCKCSPPNFCGEEHGQCAILYCLPSALNNDTQLDCNTTTTDTSTTMDLEQEVDCCVDGTPTTMTLEECCAEGGKINTSCDSDEGCQDGCEWKEIFNPFGGSHWLQISDGCTGDCYCLEPAPIRRALKCDSDCEEPQTAHTDCIGVAPKECEGYEEYIWDCNTKQWYYLGGVPCDGINLDEECECQVIGELPDEVDGDKTICITLQCGDNCDTDPCPKTTPTLPECNVDCIWKAVEDQEVEDTYLWDIYEDNDCTGDCECEDPTRVPLDSCEYTRTNCVSVTTTSTTSNTTPEPSGSCCYYDDDDEKFECISGKTPTECGEMPGEWRSALDGCDINIGSWPCSGRAICRYNILGEFINCVVAYGDSTVYPSQYIVHDFGTICENVDCPETLPTTTTSTSTSTTTTASGPCDIETIESPTVRTLAAGVTVTATAAKTAVVIDELFTMEVELKNTTASSQTIQYSKEDSNGWVTTVTNGDTYVLSPFQTLTFNETVKWTGPGGTSPFLYVLLLAYDSEDVDSLEMDWTDCA